MGNILKYNKITSAGYDKIFVTDDDISWSFKGVEL